MIATAEEERVRRSRQSVLTLAVSAACWIAAFGLFEIVYGPILVTSQPTRSGPSP